MKRIVIAALLVSMGAIAEDAATVEEAEVVTAENSSGHKDWPSLDEWSKANKLNEGILSAEFLLGYEYSDLDDPLGLDAAHGLITRTRLNYKTANYEGFDAFVQAQYVGPISDHYNPKDPSYDTIADPEAFRMHQAYLAYTGYDSHARVGPQEIILDNARFIGNVGWRLNAQSFNAGLIKNNSVEDLTLLYAYAGSINEINGDINHDRQYHMFNAEYALGEHNNISGLMYLQRNDTVTQPDKVDTFGVRAWGKNDKLIHDATIAFQRDAYYGFLSGGLDLDTFDFGAGIEYISGGDTDGDRFRTLNGTAHKFNGWADQFLGTANGAFLSGLTDVWVDASIMAGKKVKLTGVYHYFHTGLDPATFSGTYGNEIDLLAKYPVCNNFDVLAKFAYYIKSDEDITNITNDETVFWLRGTLTF